MRIRSASFTVTSLLAGLMLSAPAHAVVVTTCGQAVGSFGELAADLDCTGYAGPAVVLTQHAKLDLRGFTIYGGEEDAVECEGRCVVASKPPGGTITGASDGGIEAADGSLTVKDVAVTNNGTYGISNYGGRNRAKILRCIVSGNGSQGIDASNRKTTIADSQILNNAGCAMNVKRFLLSNTTISGNFCGINGNHGPGQVDGSSITNNGDLGVSVNEVSEGCRLKVSASTITGHTVADIDACARPLVTDTTCDKSRVAGSAGDWDVCALD